MNSGVSSSTRLLLEKACTGISFSGDDGRLRRGEVLGLGWEDVDLDAKRLVVRQQVVLDDELRTVIVPHTKSGKSRVVDFDAARVDALKAHKKGQAEERLAAGPDWRDHGLVFTKGLQLSYGEAGHPGDPLHPERFTRSFQQRTRSYNRTAKLREVEPLPVINLHALRHTHATLALMAGVHPKVVRERLGHSTIAIPLDIYSHVAPTMQQEAAEKVADLIGL